MLLAAVNGDLTVVTQQHLVVDLMAAGWLGALTGYGIGWALGRRQAASSRQPLEQIS